jgi:hypothetical protein
VVWERFNISKMEIEQEFESEGRDRGDKVIGVREKGEGEGEEVELEDDEEIQRAYEEWKKEFDEESENETDEEDEGVWEERRNYERKGNAQESTEELDPDDGVPVAVSKEDDIFLPAFDIDVNWRFGGHISLVDVYHRNQLSLKSSPEYPSFTYSHSLLPSLPLADFKEDEVLCSSFDISHTILLMLSGSSSDLFSLTSLRTESRFSLTPTGSHIRIAELTASSLRKFLEWFVDLGNRVEYVRHKLYDPHSELNFMEEEGPQKEPSSTFLHQAIGPITSSLRDIFSSFQSLLLQLECQIPDSSLEDHEVFPFDHLTFTQLYLQLRPWNQLFESMLLGITQTLCRVAASRIESSDISSYFPGLKLEDTNSFENRDFFHHLHISCLLTDLLSALSHSHLLSSHLSTISAHSSLRSLGKDFSSNQSQAKGGEEARGGLPQGTPPVSFQAACLSCFSALHGAYLKLFFTWIFHSEKAAANPKFHRNKFYSSQSHFGGLAYDHSLSLFSSSSQGPPSSSLSLAPTPSWSQYSSQQMLLKFNYFPSLWQPLLAFGAMTKINIQGLAKQGVARSLRSSLLRYPSFPLLPSSRALTLTTFTGSSSLHQRRLPSLITLFCSGPLSRSPFLL